MATLMVGGMSVENKQNGFREDPVLFHVTLLLSRRWSVQMENEIRDIRTFATLPLNFLR